MTSETQEFDLGGMEASGDLPMEFIKHGRLPELEADYARPELSAAEQRVWSVLDDGRLALRPEIDEASLSGEFREKLRLGRRNGRFA